MFNLLGAAFPATLSQQPFARFVDLQLKQWLKPWVFSHCVYKRLVFTGALFCKLLTFKLQQLHVVVCFFQI